MKILLSLDAQLAFIVTAIWIITCQYNFRTVIATKDNSNNNSENAEDDNASLIRIEVTGPPQNIWSAAETFKRCGINNDVPDVTPSLFFANGQVNMIQGAHQYHHMNGPSLFSLHRDCHIARNSTGNPDPSKFTGDEFLDSTWIFPESNGTVISLIDTEYPGNHFDNCPFPPDKYVYPYCYITTISLAVSHDFGTSFHYAKPPPHHLVATVPYQYDPLQKASGWCAPSNIVEYDGYYYVAIWNKNQNKLQKAGTCIMRTPSLLEPSSWRAWNGTEFATQFISPYSTHKPINPQDHLCETISTIPKECSAEGLAYSKSLKSFIMTVGCNVLTDKENFRYFMSKDLIQWSQPIVFFTRSNADRYLNITGMSYPIIIDTNAPFHGDPNYSVLQSNKAYLLWTSIGHSPYTDGRNSWASPIEFVVSIKDGEKMHGEDE